MIDGFEKRIGKLVEENERLNSLLAKNCTQDQELAKIQKEKEVRFLEMYESYFVRIFMLIIIEIGFSSVD